MGFVAVRREGLVTLSAGSSMPLCSTPFDANNRPRMQCLMVSRDPSGLSPSLVEPRQRAHHPDCRVAVADHDMA